MSRRLPIRSLQTTEPVLSLPELIDALQAAAVELGMMKVRGNDYSRAVASQKMRQARAKVDAAISEEAAAPLLAELGTFQQEHDDA